MSPAAIVFDLDRTLIDSRAAWCYAIEESVLAACGHRISARELYDEYGTRPIYDALSVVVSDYRRRSQCERLFAGMSERSAMKRLLVFEGIGMALDELRGARVELGAVSRLPHQLARKQIESTGIDRFLSVLEATEEGTPWAPRELLDRSAAFLEVGLAAIRYVGTEEDANSLMMLGIDAWWADWATPSPRGGPNALERPRDLAAAASIQR
jgi:phosphoglycolate phosphatase-like HAD superfamily hydrolase